MPSGSHSLDPHKGDLVQLVRWELDRNEGWKHTLITGRYWSRDSGNHRVIIDGLITSFDRSKWELCVA